MLPEMGDGRKSHPHSKSSLSCGRHHLHHPNCSLPMLCSRSSFKDIGLDRNGVDHDDPLSPKVGCMGQVKRDNRVVGLPNPSSIRVPLSAKNAGHVSRHADKHSKLKRMFSYKGLASASVSKPVTPVVRSCRAASRSVQAMATVTTVNVVDMDPPLPVTRRARKDRNVEDGNLWKRRSGGMGYWSFSGLTMGENFQCPKPKNGITTPCS